MNPQTGMYEPAVQDELQSNTQQRSHNPASPTDDRQPVSPGQTTIVKPPPQPLPQWVALVESVNSDCAAAREALTHLALLHRSILKVNFHDETGEGAQDQAADIETLSGEISTLLKRSEQSVKRIALINNQGQLSQQERLIRVNVMRACATDLQALSKQFRQAQKEYMSALKEREQIGIDLGFDDSTSTSSHRINLDEALEKGLTEEQAQQMQEMEANASEREAEILRIASSVNDLATMFRELNVLVIEQGTILDRIDYNLEQTVEKVRSGTNQIKQADNYSKKAYTAKCMAVLVVLIVVLFFVLIIQHS